MFNFLSMIFRYFFILIIYVFIFHIIRLIYLDIKNFNEGTSKDAAYLKLINRKNQLSFPVKEAYSLEHSVTIGRRKDNDIVLRDPYISGYHAKLVLDEEIFFIEDLDSANGTYLNGDRIMDVIKLKNGDRIKLGQVEFLYVSGH